MTTILIIEDASDLRKDIVEMLTLEGYTTLEAADGRRGLLLAQSRLPDLIVCDVMMPLMDGYQVLQALRFEPATATIPFVFLTSKTEHGAQRHAMALGADDYLIKPFMVTELVNTISARLRKLHEIHASANKDLDDLRLNIITALPHELRTPLNTVLGFSEMLMNKSVPVVPEQVHEWGRHIHTAGQRLLRITENYLFYARISIDLNREQDQSGHHHDCYTDVTVALTSQALQAAARYERENQLDAACEPCPEVFINEVDFHKLIDELVDNACKFSPPTSPIIVRGVLEKPYFVISVQDSGHGLSADYVRRVGAYMQFDRWFYEQQGMGLGLAIVVNILKLHHGTFTVEQPVEGGTRVIVRLLLAPTAAD